MAIVELKRASIGEIFTSNKYFVPENQREYSWNAEEHLNEFLTDLDKLIERKKDTYFIGQVVLLKENEKLFIIDGQQRLATATIFFAVLRDLFRSFSNRHKTAEYKLQDIETKYIGRYDPEEGINELKIELGIIDKDYFKKNIQLSSPKNEDVLKFSSHDRIRDAYNFFMKSIADKLSKTKDDSSKIDILKTYFEALTSKLVIIYAVTDDEDEAYIIFETLNYRGKDLETADLLKNYLFRISKDYIEDVKEHWRNTNEEIERLDTTKYLRSFWNSKYEFTREKELFGAIKNTITTPAQASAFVAEFDKHNEVYKSICLPVGNSCFADMTINSTLENIKTMNARSFYPIVIALKRAEFEESSIQKVVLTIESFYFRNCVVAGHVANRYELLFSEIAYKISEKIFTKTEEIVGALSEEISDDAQFLKFFSELSIKASPVLKYVLREIEDFGRPPEKQVNKNNKVIHIEHIMPKKLGKEGDGWEHISQEEHKKYLWKIGNITLLGDEYNNKIKNKKFATKAETYIRSSILMTNDLCKEKEWNKDSIIKRQEQLSLTALKRWKKVYLP